MLFSLVVIFVVCFSVKQMVENNELVMVKLLIDSLRNLNPLSS